MELDRSGLQVLSRDDCLRLLASAKVGRLGFTAQALPMILPVSFVVDDGGVVVRIQAGSQLHRAIPAAVVAFEADDANGRREQWSVAVTGMATEITDPVELRRIQDLPLDTWALGGADTWSGGADNDLSGDTDHFVRITLDLVSGRRKGGPDERLRE